MGPGRGATGGGGGGGGVGGGVEGVKGEGVVGVAWREFIDRPVCFRPAGRRRFVPVFLLFFFLGFGGFFFCFFFFYKLDGYRSSFFLFSFFKSNESENSVKLGKARPMIKKKLGKTRYSIEGPDLLPIGASFDWVHCFFIIFFM